MLSYYQLMPYLTRFLLYICSNFNILCKCTGTREGGREQLDENHICYFDEVDYQPVQISVFDDGSVLVHVVY